MLRIFSFLIAMCLFEVPVLAAECKSVLDIKCGIDEPVIITKGAEVKIVNFSNKIVSIPVTDELRSQFADLITDMEIYCPNQKCSCEEKIDYVTLAAKSKAIFRINSALKKQASEQRCSADNSLVRNLTRYIYTSPQFISLVMYDLEYARDSGGSCHGENNFISYDGENGKKYTLRDVVKAENIAELPKMLSEDFMKLYSKGEKPIEESVADHFINHHPEDEGFVVENGKIYSNIGSFILSCADGSFFPVEVPEKFIKPEILEKLKK